MTVLNQKDIEVLEKNGCRCADWSKVSVADGFVADRVFNVSFSGVIELGSNNTSVVIDEVETPCGILNAKLVNVTVASNVYIANVATQISNYDIEENVIINGVAKLVASKDASYGHGVEVEALNEAGGREIPLCRSLSSNVAYLVSLCRHDNAIIEGLTKIIDKEIAEVKGKRGKISKNVTISACGVLKDLFVGPYAVLDNASRLDNGWIDSCEEDPTVVGDGVIADNFIFQSGAKVTSGAVIDKVLVGQGCLIGKQFSAENSVFFANCEGFHGEACAVFGGPYTVTHHKSSLLIAGMYSFFNAGSGTNHSNHMYKLGPVHQGILERGVKTGSFSYFLMESHIAPFTTILGKNMATMNVPDFPFSYIMESGGFTYLTPAMNILTIGAVRDNDKWLSRDRRKVNDKLDLIRPDVYSPYVVEKMRRGAAIFTDLAGKTDKAVDYVDYGGLKISRLFFKKGARSYGNAIKNYLGNKLLSYIAESVEKGGSLADIKKNVFGIDTGSKDWCDLSGLLITRSAMDSVIDNIKNDKYSDLKDMQNNLLELHNEYFAEEKKYVVDVAVEEFGLDVENLSIENIKTIIEDQIKISSRFFRAILADAKIEYGATAYISYGVAGGTDEAKQKDFEAVRGSEETNKVIVKLKKDNEEYVAWLENLNKKLENI